MESLPLLLLLLLLLLLIKDRDFYVIVSFAGPPDNSLLIRRPAISLLIQCY